MFVHVSNHYFSIKFNALANMETKYLLLYIYTSLHRTGHVTPENIVCLNCKLNYTNLYNFFMLPFYCYILSFSYFKQMQFLLDQQMKLVCLCFSVFKVIDSISLCCYIKSKYVNDSIIDNLKSNQNFPNELNEIKKEG